MKYSKISQLLNIKYPIFQGGMAWIAEKDLVNYIEEKTKVNA